MKTILVIDDEEILTKTFAKLLEKAGYEVLISKTGADALEAAEEQSFDLVLCDIRMPGLDGIETVKRLREIYQRNGQISPPDIFITGYADEASEASAKALNPAAYIEKPFDAGELLNKVKELIGV